LIIKLRRESVSECLEHLLLLANTRGQRRINGCCFLRCHVSGLVEPLAERLIGLLQSRFRVFSEQLEFADTNAGRDSFSDGQDRLAEAVKAQ